MHPKAPIDALDLNMSEIHAVRVSGHNE